MSWQISSIEQWCQGRNAWVRLPLLLGFAYIFVRHLGDSQYTSILGPLNLGIHECGHLLATPIGGFFATAAGTLAQLLAPVYGMFNFLRQRDLFSVVLCFGWLATNLFNISTYAADARRMALPLVSPFAGQPYHDWNRMLTQLGWLKFDGVIGAGFWLAGIAAMGICLSGGVWMLWLMLTGGDG